MDNLIQDQEVGASTTGCIYLLLRFQGLLEIIINYISLSAKDLHNFILTSFIKQFYKGQAPTKVASKNGFLKFFEFHDHPQILSFCKQKGLKTAFYLEVLCESKLLVFKMMFDIYKKYEAIHVTSAVASKKKPTPFLVACEKGYLNDVKIFLNLLKIDVNEKGVTSQGYSCGYSGLILSSYEEKVNVVHYLLRHCNHVIDVNLEDDYGSTALHYAAYNNSKNTKTIELLLQFGCDVDKKNKSGLTPLDYAYQNASVIKQDIVRVLKSHSD